jgi:hypothetical protein
VKPREPIETRAPRELSESAESSDSAAVAEFSPPFRQLGTLPPVLVLVGSVVMFFAGSTLAVALDFGLFTVAGTGVGLLGAGTALVGAVRQLLRHVRNERRDGDHSLAVLLPLIAVGLLSSIALALWAFLMCVGNPAD